MAHGSLFRTDDPEDALHSYLRGLGPVNRARTEDDEDLGPAALPPQDKTNTDLYAYIYIYVYTLLYI